MTTGALLARRLQLPAGEVATLCSRLGLLLPPGLDVAPQGIRTEGLIIDGAVHASVAAGLKATCSPRVGVMLSSPISGLTAAFGLRVDLGGSLVRGGDSLVEVGAWPAHRLGAELARVVPVLHRGPRPTLRMPVDELADSAELQGCFGALRATVVAPPAVLGQVVWLATASGWLALEPGEVRSGRRWAIVRPVDPEDIGAAVAPFVAAALA